MNEKQHAEIVEALDDLRDSIMRKELGDDGWDLRDELLVMQQIISALVHALTPST